MARRGRGEAGLADFTRQAADTQRAIGGNRPGQSPVRPHGGPGILMLEVPAQALRLQRRREPRHGRGEVWVGGDQRESMDRVPDALDGGDGHPERRWRLAHDIDGVAGGPEP